MIVYVKTLKHKAVWFTYLFVFYWFNYKINDLLKWLCMDKRYESNQMIIERGKKNELVVKTLDISYSTLECQLLPSCIFSI